MFRKTWMAATIAAVLVVAGCAAPEIPFDRSATPEIKTIGLIDPAFPTGPSVVLASSVGQSFGLIGALVDAGMQSSRELDFTKVIVSHNFVAQETFTKSLAASLEKQGYVVSAMPLKHDKTDFLSHYPPPEDGKPDAYLDVVVAAYGYVAAGIGSSTPYRPAVALRVRLVRAKDASVLMQDAVFYNPVNATTKVVTISPDPNYVFTNFDALIGSPDKAVDGVRIAIEESARTTGGLLH